MKVVLSGKINEKYIDRDNNLQVGGHDLYFELVKFLNQNVKITIETKENRK